jgi:hypothetical protein
MQKARTLPSAKVLEKALKEYESPSSDLDRGIREELRSLDASMSQLETSFNSRAEDLEANQQGRAKKLIEKAALDLAMVQDAADKELRLTGAVSPALKFQLAFTQTMVTNADLSAGLDADFVSVSKSTERYFLTFHDQLVTICVETLWDDTALERAVVLVPAVVVAAGAFFPPTALPAAIAAALLVLNDIKGKFVASGDKKLDPVIARHERARVLLKLANKLTAELLRVQRTLHR